MLLSSVESGIGVLATVITVILMARVLVTRSPRIDKRNPLVRFVIAVADPILKPFQRLMPPVGGISLAPLAAILAIYLAAATLIQLLALGFANPLYTVVKVLDLFIQNVLLIVLIVLTGRLLIVAAKVNPWSPLGMVSRELAAPFLRPVRHLAPPRTSANVLLIGAFVFYAVLVSAAVVIFNWALSLSALHP